MLNLREQWEKLKALITEKPRFFLIGAGAGLCILIFSLILMLVVLNNGRNSRQEEARGLADRFGPMPVNQDDLFWPDEPDFIPGVELDRIPRRFPQGDTDIPYWTDPGKNSDLWSERIGSAVDELMEKIP
ncbi:hypothetical protein [Breznakiella homolactica]|uniref:Uncharacterized protein n=1 Tax=Breznakiella homolactica TaxID=2798577 RepID=A0A7T7XQK5_9SPIR|nr:hypothetical protein [Breznakiella homolactica]QQO10665.1 hypothetical protein JFL75_07040 [Breznakiella homolactica]